MMQKVKSSIKGQDVPQIEFDPANKAVWVIIGVWGVLALVAIVVYVAMSARLFAH